jgi:catechol 2,3-dioxygenase-like lactoylglutathione lyase family enzyme
MARLRARRARIWHRQGMTDDATPGRGFPDPEAELTHILVVADPARSRRWYEGVLGAEVYRAYDTSVVLRFLGAWLLLVEGGAPTDDKPTVTLASPADPDARDNLFTIRVADCRAVYETLTARGGTFLTPPVRHGNETRCFLRDPDGHLFELSEYRAPSA